jgi:type I restriction enzyme, R subunit
MPSEIITRKNLINKYLAVAGWMLDDITQVIEEFDIEARVPNQLAEDPGGYITLFSNYVLLGKDGKPLAVVEAKKSSADARLGEEQAKQYAYHIKEQYNCDLPFCFYTNGYDIFFWDIENYPPRKIYGFPSRADLEKL